MAALTIAERGKKRQKLLFLIKSQLLYQLSYRGTGTFYGRVTVDGKIYRESLETTVYSVAKQKLPDYINEKLRKKRQIGAPATFDEAQKLYEQNR